jgi:hypothetical protein
MADDDVPWRPAIRSGSETERHRKRPLLTAPPTPVTIPLEDAARHVRMTPRALMRWLHKIDTACLVRISPRRWRIDRRLYFRLLERYGLGGPEDAA